MRVIFFGDSVFAGEGVSLHKGWVPRLSAMLSELGEETGQAIVLNNRSVCGDTTRMALERMPRDVQGQGPDVLAIQFGMNDCNYWESDSGNPRVSVDAFEANIREMVRRGVTSGAKTVIVNTNHVSGRAIEPMAGTELTHQESNELYNEAIRRAVAAEGKSARLVDIEAAFKDEIRGDPMKLTELVLPDLLHLSEAGHDLCLQAAAPVVREVVTAALGQAVTV